MVSRLDMTPEVICLNIISCVAKLFASLHNILFRVFRISIRIPFGISIIYFTFILFCICTQWLMLDTIYITRASLSMPQCHKASAGNVFIFFQGYQIALRILPYPSPCYKLRTISAGNAYLGCSIILFMRHIQRRTKFPVRRVRTL